MSVNVVLELALGLAAYEPEWPSGGLPPARGSISDQAMNSLA